MKYCCINNCTNAVGKKQPSNIKFYTFPTDSVHSKWKRNKRIKWINAVKKCVKNPDDWKITQSTVICSAHFVGNEKSEHPLHPAYTPSIFPGEKSTKNLLQSVDRFERVQHRQSLAIEEPQNYYIETELVNNVGNITDDNSLIVTNRTISCQTDDFFSDFTDNINYFLCNLTSVDGIGHAEVQVNIVSKKVLNKSCEANIIK